MKKIIVNTLLCAVLVILFLIALPQLDSCAGKLGGIRFLSIQTDSMSPALEPGDLILVVKADPSDLRQKDIISYWTVIDGEVVINTHRIENIYVDGNGYLTFETKGDAKTSADPGTVIENEVIGKVMLSIPLLGGVLDFFRTSTGFIVLLLLAAAVVALIVIFNKRSPKGGRGGRAKHKAQDDDDDDYSVVYY